MSPLLTHEDGDDEAAFQEATPLAFCVETRWQRQLYLLPLFFVLLLVTVFRDEIKDKSQPVVFENGQTFEKGTVRQNNCISEKEKTIIHPPYSLYF